MGSSLRVRSVRSLPTWQPKERAGSISRCLRWIVCKALSDAASSEYTDAQIGRLIDDLGDSERPDNTLIIYAADNGALGEGSPNGTVNENRRQACGSSRLGRRSNCIAILQWRVRHAK